MRHLLVAPVVLLLGETLALGRQHRPRGVLDQEPALLDRDVSAKPIPSGPKARSAEGATSRMIPRANCDTTAQDLDAGDVYKIRKRRPLLAPEDTCLTTFSVPPGILPHVFCDRFKIGDNNTLAIAMDGQFYFTTFSGTSLRNMYVDGLEVAEAPDGYELWVDLYVNSDFDGQVRCYIEGIDASGGTPTTGSPPTVAPTATAPPPGSCECGLANEASSGRIINGEEATKAQFPWQAAMVGIGGSDPACGAALISDRWVLTAAHCTQGQDPNNPGIEILLGEHDTSASDGEIRATVARIVDHPDYNDNTLDSDWSLLELEEAVTFSQTVRPVCLPQDSSVTYDGETTVIAGWGNTVNAPNSNPIFPDILRFVEVIVDGTCGNYAASDITDNMICAADDGKDSCQGDSGGPLVFKAANDRYEVVGVTSWGFGCAEAGYPGVYARVTEALAWINSNVGQTCYP